MKWDFMSIIEKQNLELRDKLEGALYQNEKMANELKLLRECHDIMYDILMHFSKRGSGVDTNPTMTDTRDYKGMMETYVKQLRSQERIVRDNASDVVKKVDKYMSDADIV